MVGAKLPLPPSRHLVSALCSLPASGHVFRHSEKGLHGGRGDEGERADEHGTDDDARHHHPPRPPPR